MRTSVFMAWRRLAVALAVLCSVSTFATPKKVEVVVAIPDGVTLDDDLRDAVKILADEISKRLYTFDDVSAPLPESIVPPGAEFVSGETPISVAAERELLDSAHGPDGARLHLTQEQWKSIWKKGYYLVPSKHFPGQFHKWELWLIEGAEKIRILVKEADANATRMVRIGIPNLIQGNTLSIRQGFVELGKGLRGIVAHIVGFRETYPKHGPESVARLIADDIVKYMEGLAEASTGEHYDLRAFNPALVAKAQTALAALESQVEAKYYADVQEARRIPDPTERAAALEALDKARESQEPFFEAIGSSADLERIDRGLGPVLARYGRALQRLRAHELNFTDAVAKFSDEKTAELHRDYPAMSDDRDWLTRQVTAATAEYYRAHWKDSYKAAIADLRDKGFTAEAWALDRALDYLQHDGWEKARALNRERLPVRRIPYEFWSFDSGKWKKTQLPNGSWALEPTSKVEVTSNWPLWKLQRLWYTTGWSFQSGVREVLVEWLWNGPVGFRSLYKTEKYPGRWVLDAKTGELVAPESGYHSTLWTNLKGLYASIKRDRERYAAAPDSGMFGKFPKRVWQFFWSDLAKGVVAPVFLVGGRVLATGVTTVLGGGVAVTAPVWAPLVGTLEYGWTTLVADSYPVRDLPSYQRSHYAEPGLIVDVLRITVSGAGQVALAGGIAAATPVAAAGVSVGARLWSAARYLWQGAMYGIHRGLGYVFGAKVPTDNSEYFVYHKEGPGVGANTFVTIDDDAAVLASLLQLEIAVLDSYRAQMLAWQREPYANAQTVIGNIPWTALGIAAGRNEITRELGDRLASPMAESVKQMEQAIADRRKRLTPLLTALAQVRQQYGSNGVRLSQDQIDRLMPQIAGAYRKLLEGNKLFPPTLPEVRRTFWDTNTEGVANAYDVLAKNLVTATLGRDALTPPSLDAGKFQTRVHHPSIGGLLTQVLAGNDLDVDVHYEDTNVGPITPATPTPVKPAETKPTAPRETVRVSAADMCASELVSLARQGIVEGRAPHF